MTQAPADPAGHLLTALVETWHQSCADFVALVRELPRVEWDLPTDLPGWSVRDVVAHTAHLEAVLAGAPEETLEVAAAPHLSSPMSYYTEQGVLARRGRDVSELADEIERSVQQRYDDLRATPPTDPDAPPPRTPGGIRWSTRTLLGNRPVDVWMHEQDIRRATGRPGGYHSLAAAHTIATFGRALPMVVGKRLAPPPGTTVHVEVPDAEASWTVAVADDGRALACDPVGGPSAAVTLRAEEFVVLCGGRRTPETTRPVLAGDEELGRRLLGALAVTP